MSRHPPPQRPDDHRPTSRSREAWPPKKPKRIPLWQLALLGVVRAFQGLVTHPLKRMWTSSDPIDAYALNHLTSVAGDAFLAISLSNSVFFSLPVGEARLRVAAYLALTMLPLALAGPLIVPILDRAGPRRSVTFTAAAGRSVLAVLLASRLNTPLLFPLALLILVLSKVHGIVKNGLTMAYAGREEGLMRANARLGRIAVAGAIAAAVIGIPALKLAGGPTPIELAAVTYAASALLTIRLPKPEVPQAPARAARTSTKTSARGRVPELRAPAIGAVGLRAAGGFLLFLLAFSLREKAVPASWFGVVAAAGVIGGFLADLLAPSLPTETREEAVVATCVVGAGVSALLVSQLFGLPLLAFYALVAGAASEFSRLAFQSLMQRYAPAGALGRVFVRYEVMFQVAWVVAAFIPTVLALPFRTGVILLALFYVVLGAAQWWWLRRARETGLTG
ncbi:MAG: hypothetical protein ACXVWF_03975 [Actinomycetota bacterium]